VREIRRSVSAGGRIRLERGDA